jgi:hypothetical protein
MPRCASNRRARRRRSPRCRSIVRWHALQQAEAVGGDHYLDVQMNSPRLILRHGPAIVTPAAVGELLPARRAR